MCLVFLFLTLILVHNIILTIFLFDFIYLQGMSGVSLILTSWLVGGDERQASKCKGIFIFHQPALPFLTLLFLFLFQHSTTKNADDHDLARCLEMDA